MTFGISAIFCNKTIVVFAISDLFEPKMCLAICVSDAAHTYGVINAMAGSLKVILGKMSYILCQGSRTCQYQIKAIAGFYLCHQILMKNDILYIELTCQ